MPNTNDVPAKLHWSPSRLTDEMKSSSLASIGVAINVASWRHIAIAWTQNDVMDTQATHSTAVAIHHYAKEFLDGGYTAPINYKFRHASQLWHRFLGLDTAAVTDVDVGMNIDDLDVMEAAERSRAQREHQASCLWNKAF
ncbi:uncharacterized protein LY79DRAFT_673113 [Colletotrichum navitas]|uniref:Uncharacterized protein n=1 Tax=Colletotrichum navitas TaxID=681940 RepID=A0AAD8PQ11_9PEZI|nr:uncharacterized protein LY79DRAFT_673113 [Colletotrichum navitas]KAK1574192.1 hypothetical protein LY79DRAFT_673113 [Colletotrichum navitas]